MYTAIYSSHNSYIMPLSWSPGKSGKMLKKNHCQDLLIISTYYKSLLWYKM